MPFDPSEHGRRQFLKRATALTAGTVGTAAVTAPAAADTDEFPVEMHQDGTVGDGNNHTDTTYDYGFTFGLNIEKVGDAYDEDFQLGCSACHYASDPDSMGRHIVKLEDEYGVAIKAGDDQELLGISPTAGNGLYDDTTSEQQDDILTAVGTAAGVVTAIAGGPVAGAVSTGYGTVMGIKSLVEEEADDGTERGDHLFELDHSVSSQSEMPATNFCRWDVDADSSSAMRVKNAMELQTNYNDYLIGVDVKLGFNYQNYSTYEYHRIGVLEKNYIFESIGAGDPVDYL